MIYLIIYDFDHNTNKEILIRLKNKKIPHEFINPDIGFLKIKEIIDNCMVNNDVLLILKPEHDTIYKLCEYALEKGINTINSPKTTLIFRDRWKIDCELEKIFKENEECLENLKIKLPFFYLVSPLDNTNCEETIKSNLKNLVNKLPLVAKLPLNHTGKHFIRLIKNKNQLFSLIPLIINNGVYFQQFIESNRDMIKCYNLGNDLYSQTESYELKEFISPPSTIKNHNIVDVILKDNETILTKESKESRKSIQTPPYLLEFVNLIRNKIGIDIFGMDFVIDNEENTFLVDINDFPGARSIKNAGFIIADHIIEKYQRIFKK